MPIFKIWTGDRKKKVLLAIKESENLVEHLILKGKILCIL